MTCPRCQAENPVGMRFCGQCAAPLETTCPSCGAANPPGHKFCGHCAAGLNNPAASRFTAPESYTPKHLAEKILTSRSALEGERKQVTVLFVDVSGFTSLSEKLDPEDVHGLMTRAFELMLGAVHRYEGTVNQFLGDGIMALFGAPLTHEDHVQRAVHAALDISKALERYQDDLQSRGIFFRVRQGLNTGLVVVGSIGSDLRMDYTALGDTTNTAARLQQMAPPGGIWVGETTHRGAREAFEWKAVGPIAMKGKTEPVLVYEVVAERAVKSRFEMREQRGLTRFVGRDADLQLLVGAWGEVRQGQGQVVSVIGEAGIGKSRLVHEFKEQLAREGARYVEGSCFAYGVAMSYLPFLAIVKELFGLDGTDAEADAKRQIARHLANLQVEAGRVAPYVHNLLAFAADDERFSSLTSELLRQRTVEALATLVLAEATHHPWVLIVEDVHWVDNATEEVLTALIAGMATVPLLLVLVYRPEYLQTGRARGACVALDQLSPEQSQAMVQDLLGTATLPPAIAQLIARNTDGNPFFVEELTRSLLESGDLVRTETGYVARKPLTTLDLPTTVQGVLLARIDRLPEALKEVLQIASVIGRVFTHALLAHVVPLELDLDAMLAELAALEFVHATAPVPLRAYSFKHVLTQEAVYQTLLRPKREEFHERIGAALEALYHDGLEEYYEVLAYHYVRSGNKDKAVEYLDLSNRKAARASAMIEAKAYFDNAVKLLSTMPDTEVNRRRTITLLVNQGWVMNALLELPDYYSALTRYEAMAVSLGHPGLLGALYAREGWCEWSFGEFDRAIRTTSKATKLCEAAGDGDDAAQAYVHWQWSHMCKGEFHQSLARSADVLRSLEGRTNLRLYLFAVTGASIAYTWLGRWEHAVEEGCKALRAGEEFSDNSIVSMAAMTLSMAYTAKGDLARAIEYGEHAVQMAPTPGDKVWSSCALAAARCRAGEAGNNIEILEQGVSALRAARFIWSEVCALWLAESYELTGEYDKATHALEELLAIATRCGMKFHIGCAQRLLAEIALATNPTQAEEPLAASHFEQSMAILKEIDAAHELTLARAGYVRLQNHLGPRAS